MTDDALRLRATLTVRNDHMISARKKLGLSQAALAAACEVPMTTVTALEQLRYHFMTSDRTRNQARKIADFLDLDVRHVLPRDLEGRDLDMDRTVISWAKHDALLAVAATQESKLLSMDPSAAMAAREAEKELEDIFNEAKLTPRERLILTHRHCLKGANKKTLDELGADMRISRERVRNVEIHAVGKLQRAAVLHAARRTRP